METQYFNRGIYSYSEASRLISLSPARIRGLINGYKYPNKKPKPVIKKHSLAYANREYLSFLDLIELKFITHFLKIGIKRSEIINSYKKARNELRKEYPFATKFTTDGKYILAENKAILLKLADEQLELKGLLESNLYEGIDFKDDIAQSWRPYVKEFPHVILDPTKKYGHPIIDDYGIQTASILDMYLAENHNYKKLEEVYSIPTVLLKEAVQFEQRLG